LQLLSTTWWFRSWHLLDDIASPWDPGTSFHRRRFIPYLLVNGGLLPRQLHRSSYNRRFVQSTPGCMRPRRLCDPPSAASTSSSPWIALPCSSVVSGLFCILVFFRGPFCNSAAVISYYISIYVCCQKMLSSHSHSSSLSLHSTVFSLSFWQRSWSPKEVASSGVGGGAGEQQDLRRGWAPSPTSACSGEQLRRGPSSPARTSRVRTHVSFWIFLSSCYSKRFCKIFIQIFFFMLLINFSKKRLRNLFCEFFYIFFAKCLFRSFCVKSFWLTFCSRYFFWNFFQCLYFTLDIFCVFFWEIVSNIFSFFQNICSEVCVKILCCDFCSRYFHQIDLFQIILWNLVHKFLKKIISKFFYDSFVFFLFFFFVLWQIVHVTNAV
jgi:hypothetical protein